ncbi:hypothetical protein ACFZAU_21380 [Streptomyces sp. NPDC008238]
MGLPERDRRREPDRDPDESAGRGSEPAREDEEEPRAEEQGIRPREKQRGTGLEDF